MSYKLQGQGPACFCSLELNALPPGLPLAPDPRKMAQICTPAPLAGSRLVTTSGLSPSLGRKALSKLEEVVRLTSADTG